MQIANETIAMIIASFMRLGIRLNDGLCGERNLKLRKQKQNNEYIRMELYPRPIVLTIFTL